MNLERTVIALGFFDGVHRGHGALLQKTVQRAGELGAIPAVFTFDRPPKEVVTGKPVYLINSPEDRRGLIERKPHPFDGRAVGLHLTPAGEALVKEAERAVIELEAEASSKLTARERETLIRLLQKIYL